MAFSCQHCNRSIDFLGERPSFCPYCGKPLAASTVSMIRVGSTERDVDATADFQYLDATKAPGSLAATTRRLPETVAGYRLIRKLGQGGMGSVHEAEDSTSGRRVAVKLIAPEYTASVVAVERFLQEGRLASAIAHPRCVFVLAADQSDGWPFIVMELMPGDTLKDLVEQHGPMPQGDAVRKIMDVIEGLEEAHKLGVIHRDVKPSNCFLDAEGRVKVGDFGLSKSLLGSDADLTRTGSFLGTPHYASPEQIKGEPIDARSDVYSVAATLYYLLTGQPPHSASDATVALARIVSDDAPSIRSIRPEVWSALDDVVMRGLERDRKRRYRSLEEFREALAPFLPGRVVLGRFGLRAGAYLVDFMITVLLVSLTIVLSNLIHPGLILRDDHPRANDRRVELVSAAVVLIYFALFEVAGAASPGKRLTRLRVISVARGGEASWSESILRLLVFAAITLIPLRLYVFLLADWQTGTGEVFSIERLIQLVSLAILFSTARASNGYRGIHELLSGTAVVSIPGKYRRSWDRRNRPDPTPLNLLEVRPDEMPRVLGSFKIRGALVWTSERRLLLGEDSGLSRPVWIVLRPSGNPVESPARRDVGRIARARWLASGGHDGWVWDAYVAPSGHPLPAFVRPGYGLGWPEVRSLLETLAVELDAALMDGTMPAGLALDRVWVQADGRVLLLDALLDPLAGPAGEVMGHDPHERSLELLRQVAICGLSGTRPGDPSHPTPVGAPVPGHAIHPTERLCRLAEPYTKIGQFREDLDASKNHEPELTRFQRLGFAAYKLVVTELKAFLLPTLVVLLTLVFHMVAREPARFPSERAMNRVLFFQSCLWVLVAMMFRQGPGAIVFGLTIVRRDGRPASRLLLGWREAVVWLPLLISASLIELVPPDGALRWVRMFGTAAVAGLIPVLMVAHFLIFRGRFLNDRIAGTAVVPR